MVFMMRRNANASSSQSRKPEPPPPPAQQVQQPRKKLSFREPEVVSRGGHPRLGTTAVAIPDTRTDELELQDEELQVTRTATVTSGSA